MLVSKDFKRLIEDVAKDRFRCLALYHVGKTLLNQLKEKNKLFSFWDLDSKLLSFKKITSQSNNNDLNKYFNSFQEFLIDAFSGLSNDQVDSLSLPKDISNYFPISFNDILQKIQNRIIGNIAIDVLENPKIDTKTGSVLIPIKLTSQRASQRLATIMSDPKIIKFDNYFPVELLLGKKENNSIYFEMKGKEFKLFCIQTVSLGSEKTFEKQLVKTLQSISLVKPTAFNPQISEEEQKARVKAFAEKYLDSIRKS
jgi:hypothetical protein